MRGPRISIQGPVKLYMRTINHHHRVNRKRAVQTVEITYVIYLLWFQIGGSTVNQKLYFSCRKVSQSIFFFVSFFGAFGGAMLLEQKCIHRGG